MILNLNDFDLKELQDWRYIEAYQALKAAEKAKADEKKVIRANNDYKMKLEAQIKEAEKKKKLEEEERQKFRDEQKTAFEIWQAEQEKLKKEIMMKHASIKI